MSASAATPLANAAAAPQTDDQETSFLGADPGAASTADLPATVAEETPRARVEGGYDAVVVGATIDGLVAAAFLGRAGLKTLLLEAGLPQVTRREFSNGYYADDGDFFIRDLNPDVVNTLDLYRHGLCFAQRRFDTMYYFADKTALYLSGDLYAAYQSVADFDEDEAERFQAFVVEILDAAHELRPFFAGEAAPKLSRRSARLIERYATASLDFALAREIGDTRLRDLLAAEASFHSSVRPSDPHSFMSLLRRWSGEAAGLQGGCALASSGYSGVFNALRRAVQVAGVEIRGGADVAAMSVEWDVAAGVRMTDGGEIRAPIVVNALNAETAFVGQVGPSLIDIEFQRAIRAPRPHYASAKVHFALLGAPKDDNTRRNLSRRLVYAPDQAQMRRAFRTAREGGVAPNHLLMEIVFPSAFETGWAPENGNLAAGWIYPVPYEPPHDETFRQQLAKAALNTFSMIVPGARERLDAIDIQLAADMGQSAGLAAHGFGGRAAVLAEAQRTRAVRTA
ncbi:MAG: hypothetical protein AAGC56_14805, partial [Pseudomonadota bacterium]